MEPGSNYVQSVEQPCWFTLPPRSRVTLTVVNPTGYAANVYGSSGGGPRVFYPLDETSGSTIFDRSGTHDGVISGG